MKIVVCVVTMCIATAQYAAGQTANPSKGQGYVFFGPGVGNIGSGRANIHFGGGGEGFIYKGLGIGVEIGGVGPWSTHSQFAGFSDWVVGLGSAYLSYHLLQKTSERKLEPFVSAGYSLFFRAGLSHGSNFGGGVNVWLKQKVGMRFEVRTQQSYNRDSTNFRVGVTFR